MQKVYGQRRDLFLPRALVAYLLYLIGLASAYLALGYGFAWWWLRDEERAWAATGATPDIPGRYPRTQPNDAARRLDEVAAPLGVQFVEPQREHAQLKAISAFVSQFAKLPDDAASPQLPSDLKRFIIGHDSHLRAIEQELLTGSDITWELDLDTPSPPRLSLLAYRYLQSLLLARALDASRYGAMPEASRALEASWLLSRAMCARPELVAQLMCTALARSRNGALRHLRDPPPVWADRVVSHDLTAAWLTALRVEIYSFGSLARRPKGLRDLERPIDEPPEPGPGVWLFRLFTAPYLRLSIASYSEHLRAASEELRQDPCDASADELREAFRRRPPRWNVIGRIAGPSVVASWPTAVRGALDAERTRAVIQARRQDPRDWPPPDFHSSVCPEIVWLHAVDDGRLIIGPEVDIQLEDEPDDLSFTITRTRRHR